MVSRTLSVKFNYKSCLFEIFIAILFLARFFSIEIYSELKYYGAIVAIIVYTVHKPNWLNVTLKRYVSKSALFVWKKFLKYTMIPFVFAVGYSIFLLMIGRSTVHYVWGGISDSLHMFVVIVFVAMIIDIFKEKAVVVVFRGMIISYSLTLIMAFIGLGANVFFSYIANPSAYGTNVSRWFEMHDLIFAIGFFIIYYLFNKTDISKRRKVFYVLLACLFFYIGYKRIGIAALLCAVLMGILIGNSGKYRSMERPLR